MAHLALLLLASLELAIAFSQISRPTAFSFIPATGISNRLITPDGNGKNDSTVFTFSNPRYSEVTGRIYGLTGQLVAEMTPGPTPGTTLRWDGRKDGRPVASGLYLFRLSAEDRTYAGVVAVLR